MSDWLPTIGTVFVVFVVATILSVGLVALVVAMGPPSVASIAVLFFGVFVAGVGLAIGLIKFMERS